MDANANLTPLDSSSSDPLTQMGKTLEKDFGPVKKTFAASLTGQFKATLEDIQQGAKKLFDYTPENSMTHNIAHGLLNFSSLACLGKPAEEVKNNPIYQKALEDTRQAKAIAIAKAFGRGGALVLGSLLIFASRLLAFGAAGALTAGLTIFGIVGGGLTFVAFGPMVLALSKLGALTFGGFFGGLGVGVFSKVAIDAIAKSIGCIGTVAGVIPAYIGSRLIDLAIDPKENEEESTFDRVIRQNQIQVAQAGAITGVAVGIICSSIILAG